MQRLIRGLFRTRTPLAAIAMAALMIVSAPRAGAQGSLPDADSLFTAHVEAIGGRAAIEAMSNRMVFGAIEFASGEVQVLIVAQIAPNRLHYVTQSPGRFSTVRAYNGEHAWGIEPDGRYVLIDPGSDESRDLRFNAVFLGDAAFETQYPQRQTTEETLFADKPAYAVDVTSATGQSQRLFFDKESRMLVGKSVVVGAGANPTELVFNYDEYTEYDGVKLVSRQRQTLRGQVNTVWTEFVRTNVPDEDLPNLALPEELAAEASASASASTDG